MEKIKKWRTLLIALLTLLFAATLSLALVQVIPSKAEDNVLEGNTATFTVENDMAAVNQNDDSRWTYDRETNEWRSSKKYRNIKKGTSIKLTVVEPGNMVFSWKVGSSSGNTSVLITKTHAEEEVETIVDKKELTSSVWKGYTSYSSPVTISNLQNGDVVEFKWTSNSSTSSSSYCLMIKGLNPPTNQFSITAKVAADSIDHGTIKTEKPEETFDESGHQLIAQRGYCESVTFTALPEDGYTAYWKSSDGKFVSHVAEFTVSNITQSKDDSASIFTVYFVKLNEDGTKISFDAPIDGKAHFEKSQQDEIDVYTVADLKNLTKNDTVSLYIEFTGEKYVSYERVMVKTGSLSALFDGCSVDGESKTITNGSECIYFHVTGEGYHVIKITVKFSDFGMLGSDERSAIQEGDSYTVKNIRFQDKDHPFEESITVKYNPHYSELYYNGTLQEADDTNAVIEKRLTVPLADEYTIQLKPKAEVTSSLDPLQMAEVVYKNGTANATYYYGIGGDGEYRKPAFQSQADKSVTFTISRFDNQYAINTKLDGSTAKKSFNLDEGAETLVLEINYMERAPIPKVSAIKTIDNEETEIESITDGQVLDFPFLHNNSLSLRIQKIEGLEQTDFSVLVNNVERNASLQDYENIFLLPIQDVGNTQVVIRYLKSSEMIDFSAYSLSFRLGEFPEEDKNGTDITKAVHLDENSGRASLDMTAMDMVSYNKPPRWLFDPELSAEGNYAYTTTSQVNQDGEYYQGESNLKYITFELSGEAQGSLTFQFRASGYIGQEVLSGSYRGGLLYAAPQSAVNSLSNYTPYCTSSDGIKWTDPDSAVTLLAKPRPEGGMEYGSTVVPLDDGWYQASVPIKQGFANNIYLLFITYYPTNSSYPIDRIPIASASIRDVRVVTGEKTVSVSTSAEADDATATVAVGDVQHQNGSDSFKVNAGTMANLSVDAKGKKFYGWSVNGQLVSTEPNASIFINADSVIKAWIADEGTYEARTEGTFYTSTAAAVKAANSGQTVIVIKDGATINENLEIKTGVTLLLPYSKENRLTATGTPDVNSKDKIAWIADSATYRYLTVTVKGTATITVKGTLAVGGVVNYPKGQGYQGHTSGAYSELILETGSKIQVSKGGVMDVYGRVWGGEGHEGTDMGTIDVADGGKLYQPFLILDYTGGTNALGLFMAGQTPFRRYAMINIEVPTTINYGGMLYGHASLWIETFKMLASLDQPFVSYYMGEKLGGDGNGNDTFVMLHKGASVTITYDPTKVIGSPTTADCTEGIGKIKMVFEGGADFSYMLFSAMGISVPTNSVYFSIPYNYEVEMNDFAAPQDGVHAEYVTKTDFMLMPGAIVKVGKNATLTLNANTWVYDGLEQNKLSGKGYPTVSQLDGIYSKSGNLIIDGTLKIGQKTTVQQFELFEPAEPFVPKIIPALFLGIIQTNGTGTIIVPEGTELSGQIVDGADGTNYFAYATTARLYDAAHGVLTPLVPEGETKLSEAHTYKATGSTEFKLEALKYANAEGGEESQTLTLNVVMHGSWMVEHDKDSFDWSKLLDGEGQFKDNKNYEVLEHVCTELGCDHKDHRLLLKSDSIKISAIYKGENFSQDELAQLLIKYFFGDGDALPEEVAEFFTLTKEDGKPAIVFTVTLDGDGQTNNANAATYSDLTLSAEGCFFGSSMDKTAKFAFTVEQFDLEKGDAAKIQEIKDAIAAKLTGFTYDGTEHKREVNTLGDGVFNGTLLNIEKAEWAHNVDAGERTASVTLTGTGNFTGTLTVTFSIAKAELTVTIVAAGSTYGEEIKTPDLTLSGDVAKDTAEIRKAITVKVDAAQWSDVGTYAVTATEDKAADVLKNYEVKFANNEEKIYTVSAKNIEGAAKATAASKTYNGAVQDAELKITFDGYLERFTGQYKVTYDKEEVKNARTYTVTITGQNNFSGEITCAFEITKAEVTVKVLQQTYTYNRSEQSFQDREDAWEATLLGEDAKSVLGVTLVGAATDAGTYAVKAHFENDNYNVTFKDADKALVIEKATINSAAVEQGTYTYSGQAITPKLTVNAGELTLEATEYSVSYDDNINAGKVTVTVTTEHKNFQGSATANFEIQKKDISEATVSVQGTYTYNGEAQSVEKENVTVTLDGITGDVTFNIKADGYTANTDAGEATLTIEGTGNFTGTAEGNFQIAQKAIKIRPKNVSATYGDDEQALSFELYESELAAKDDERVLDVKLERAQGTNVNVYEIRITSATAANYAIDFSATGTYSIAKKKITVTVKDQTYTYNGSAQSVQSRYKTDWELAEDTLEYDDAETVLGVVLSGTGKDVKADGYPITGSYKANNYEVEFTKEGKLRIEKAEVTVKANDGQTPEGETQAELSFTVSGYFEDVGAFKKTIKIYVDGDVEASKAGTELKIVVTFEEGTTAANYPNYNVKFIQGTYTIMEAVFRGVTFTGETVVYDGTEHTITVKGLDLANAHKGANVVYTQDGKPFVSAVDAGTYSITATVSLGEYNPLVLNATLKIEKREVEITLKDATSVYGAALAELTFTHAKGVDKDREIIEKAVHLTTTATSLSDVAGSYTINASFDETTNYTFKVMNTAKYTLTPKAIEVTILQQNWAIYTGKEQRARSSVSEWTVEAGALVGNDSTTGLKVTLTGGGTDVGSYPIEGTSANGNYTVTFKGGEKAFVIAPKNLSEAAIGGLDLTFTYNEKQQRPVVTVTLSGFDAELKLQEEYTVEYGHNITVAEGGSVTVKGTGNFCGEASKTFRIVPKEISGASIEVTEENILFKNAQWQPSFTAALEGYDSFVRDTDYTVEYGANLHVGETEGTITLKGQGNFGGTATMHFAILAAPLANVTVEEEGFIYTGKPIRPRITVTANGLTLTKNDYSVSYGERGNVNAGQAEVIVTATNPDYTGTAKAIFEIAPKDLQGARVAVTGSYTYNGSAITPRKEEITVTLSGYEGITFSFAATENVDATRTALVTVTGTENFCGTASAYFTIGAKEIAATLTAQSFVYSGKVPVPDSTQYTLAEDALCSQNGKTDVLGVVITTNAKKDVGTYSLSATAANKNYKVNFDTAAQLTITKKAITVKADNITAYYGEKIKPYTFTAEGLAEGEKQEELVALGELKVTLYVDSTISDAKTYPIRGEGSAKNYSFEVEGGTYTVLPKEITVTIESHEKVYDGTVPTVNSSDWRVPAGSVVGTDNLGIVLEVVDAAAGVKDGGYTIRGTASNQNYHVTFIEGTFTISPRPITVQIEDQSETFDYDKAHHTEASEYAFDPAAWRIVEDGNTFAGDETSEVLGLTLSVDPLVHAGVYAIRGSWSNKNYLVRFTGSYKSDDDLSGKAGTYTIAKLDVSDFVVFMLEAGEAGDEGVMENDRTVRVRFEGTPIKLACSATLFMGAEPIDLATTLDHNSLGEVGDFEVLVTIEDTDYCGSATFLVVVTDADGYTQHLRDVLEDLAALAQKLGPELDADDYATLVEMSEALASLNDAEKEVGAEQLKPYQNYVDEWNDLAAIDDVIDTAKTIANAPIGAIFAAAAAISALAALAYIVCKGGIL